MTHNNNNYGYIIIIGLEGYRVGGWAIGLELGLYRGMENVQKEEWFL